MTSKITDEIKLGYFALSLALPQGPLNSQLLNNKTCWIMNSSNYNAIIKENIDSILEYSKVKELYYRFSSDENYSDEYKMLYNKIDYFQQGLISSLKSSIKSKAVKSARMYLPFIRLSRITNTFIYTHFLLIEYIDNKSEFVIFEEIPSFDEYTKDITASIKYVSSSISSVRMSCFMHKYYKYLNIERGDSNVFINYILSVFIKSNFNIDFNPNKANKYICSNNILQCSINKSTKKQLSNSNKVFRIGLTSDINYYQYMKHAIELTVDYIAYNHIEKIIIKYLKSPDDCQTKLHRIDVNTTLNSLLKLSSKNKINLNPTIDKYIYEQQIKRLFDITKDISKIIFEAYFNSQQ